jgi:hypothetical protein
MSTLQYTIVNQSAVAKTFTYFSASAYHKISVGGFGTIVFDASSSYAPTQDVTGIPEIDFVSDAYIPPSGSAWLWNNGEKVQYIKISNTPATGSNIGSVINRAEWIEFSMVEAIDKNGNYLYPTSPNSARVERYVISNANDKGLYNSIIINDSSTETSTAVAANTSSAETGFSYIDQQFSIDQDCDPLLNNAVEPRPNEWLQDVDYSVNAITPINFDQLINFTATKASVPQSNYTQLGFVHSRYVGSSTTRTQINEYNPLLTVDLENKLVYNDEAPSFFINKGKGAPLGKIPNVELNNAYIAYFNRIVDPYPLLNNKVAYYVKYLIDEGGNILDPNVSDINFSIFTDTFQLRDYDNTPTRVNTAISNIEQGKELVKLTDGLHSVHTVGAYPVPILYTQTSSIGHVNSISLSGSSFYSALGLGKNFIKLGMDIYSTQSDAPAATNRTQSLDIDINELEWLPVNITPFKSNTPVTLPTSSTYPTYALLFPLDNTGSAFPLSTPGGTLSDNYRVNGSFTFTTSTIPAEYSGRDSPNLDAYLKDYKERNPYRKTSVVQVNLTPYRKPPGDGDNVSNYDIDIRGFNVKNIKLTITTNPGGANEQIWSPLTIEQKPQEYGNQWVLTSSGLVFTPNSLYIEDLIIRNLLGQNNVKNVDARMDALPLIAGGWATASGDTYGYGGIPVKYDWVIDFEFTNILQNTGIFLKVNSEFLVSQSGAKHGLFGQRPDDVFLFFGANGSPQNNLQWRRTFTPTYTGIIPKPILKYQITSPLSENAVQNTANGPFWRRISGSIDELYMSSSILNQTYGIKQDDGTYNPTFLQAKLPYNGAVNTDFPLTVEPSFIEFDPVSDVWTLEEGDEIRFENNENLTYRITSVGGRDAIISPKDVNSEDVTNKLKVVVTPPFDENKQPSNFDFFVVRRYKENKNFIILDQQMPYGIISTGKGEVAFSGEDGFVGVEPVNPSSSPGLLLPQFRVDKFNTNPDLVLKDLIEKRII